MKEKLKDILPFNNREDMPASRYAAKRMLVFWLCYIVGAFAAEWVVIGLHLALGKNILRGETFGPTTMTVITNLGFIIFIGAALLYQKLIAREPVSEIGINKPFSSFFVGAAAGALLVCLSAVLIILTGKIEFHGVFKEIAVVKILLLSCSFLVQSTAEELLCRGLIFLPLMKKTSFTLAYLVSTAMFIIPHLSSFESGAALIIMGLVDLMLVSLIFCQLTAHFNSIWAACGLHAVWNAVLSCVLGLDLSGNKGAAAAVFDLRSSGKNILNGGKYGIEASIITAAVLASAAALLWFLDRKKKG